MLAQQTDAWVPAKGHGTFSLAYQDLYVHYHNDARGHRAVPGTIRERGVFAAIDYGLSDRLTLSVAVPFKSNRYRGRSHPPLAHHHEDARLEDGRYHGGLADWTAGLRYQCSADPWAITPHLEYVVPSHDYLTYAHNALGTGQRRLDLGVSVGRRLDPPRQNLYFQGDVAYAFMEMIDHRRVDHATLSLEMGWFPTPRLAARLVFVGQKTFNGLDFPDDYANVEEDVLFAHDQNLRNDFVNIGVGLDYRLDDRYAVFANYGHTLWGENTHLIDYAVTVGIARSF